MGSGSKSQVWVRLGSVSLVQVGYQKVRFSVLRAFLGFSDQNSHWVVVWVFFFWGWDEFR